MSNDPVQNIHLDSDVSLACLYVNTLPRQLIMVPLHLQCNYHISTEHKINDNSDLQCVHVCLYNIMFSPAYFECLDVRAFNEQIPLIFKWVEHKCFDVVIN